MLSLGEETVVEESAADIISISLGERGTNTESELFEFEDISFELELREVFSRSE